MTKTSEVLSLPNAVICLYGMSSDAVATNVPVQNFLTLLIEVSKICHLTYADQLAIITEVHWLLRCFSLGS